MSGIIFLGTRNLESMRDFYVNDIGMEVWLEQAECFILKHGNMLLGFCKRDAPDTQGVITFFFDTNEEVDSFYEKFKEKADAPPRINERYRIYNFFSRDPEGRKIEFQRFLHNIPKII